MPKWKSGTVVRAAIVAGLLGWLVVMRQPAGLAAPSAVNWPYLLLLEVESGFSNPVHITHDDNDPDRLFVVEQRGEIQIVDNGQMLGTSFLNISATGPNLAPDPAHRRVQCCGEEGLLSVAFPPGYSGQAGDHFYVYYNNLASNLVIARYFVVGADEADPASEQIILTINHPGQTNHNGGQLAFGPNDGYLYTATGDGGGGGDPDDSAQDEGVLLGKVLRLDVETGSPITYTIPATNPFTQTVPLDEIWALGVRNPWRFSFDRLTGDLYIGDVGQGAWEEIDFQPAASTGGENYGWRCYEGNAPYNPADCGPPGDYDFPVATYPRLGGSAVSGGYVYRGAAYPGLLGIYFYADYITGQVWGLQLDGATWQSRELLNTTYNISTFGEDLAGNLYLADRGGNRIYEVTAADHVRFLPLIRRS